MSRWIEQLRGPVGDGDFETAEAHYVFIGLPHPYWQEMCDVVDAAAKLEWRMRRRGMRLYTARWRLNKALDDLRAKVKAGTEDPARPAEGKAD